ncbi:MAG: hypothetical protein VCF25_29565 [Candidatus Poribacteria bacterium]
MHEFRPPSVYPITISNLTNLKTIDILDRLENLYKTAKMARLEDITKGTRLSGLSGPGIVTVESVQWSGTQALKVIFRQADSQLGERLLYRVSFFSDLLFL